MMFLVLVESVSDMGKAWSVVAHGPAYIRSIFPTREAAEKVAMELAEKQPNRFAVVEIRSWYQQEAPPVRVVETRIG